MSKLIEASAMPVYRVSGMPELCAEVQVGAGTVVISEESLRADSAALIAELARQPVWSDLPLIVLSRAGHESGALAHLVARLGNVSVIERPVRTTTLLSLIRSNQRARARQYDLREHLAEREQLLRSERTARGEAERASRMKEEFLATLSHELRTPLHAVLGWTQVLRRKEGLSEDVAKGLTTIERNARSQARIIEELLDMSSIISGKVRLDVQNVDLAVIVNATIETVRPTAQAKDVRVQSVLDPRAGPLRGDPNRLQQVLWNLLTNAVKFTPRGGRVAVTLARVNSHVELQVEDNGEGIDPAFLPQVFDRFRQADASSTRRHGGLGLGLSIVKQLVELHGGMIRAHSGGRGQGSSFRIDLPLLPIGVETVDDKELRHHPLRAFAMQDAPGTRDSMHLEGLTILVVDDELDSRSLVQRLLEDCGARVSLAASAEEALAELERTAPDVLVSDIGMPGQDGYALMRRVRALPGRTAKVPAIALTAYARTEDRVKATEAGYQSHLAKPVEPIELVSVIRSLKTHPVNG